MGKLIIAAVIASAVVAVLVAFGRPAPRPAYYWRE
jgi:hypothetical protein